MNTSLKKVLRLTSITIVVLVVLGYTYVQVDDLLRGPRLTVIEPANGLAVDSSYLPIRGFVDNVSKMTLNDRSIVFDERGFFNESLLVSTGYNIIELTVEDRFGRQKTKTLEVLLN